MQWWEGFQIREFALSPPEMNKTFFICPMHPEVKSDQPGKCPKCGMNLEAKK
jgi:hypothetical protein